MRDHAVRIDPSRLLLFWMTAVPSLLRHLTPYERRLMNWRPTLLGLAVIAISLSTQAADPAARPNIVLIIADDVSAEDCSPYGNKGVKTPNLDRLAREGMRCDRAFLTCSSCSPSRSSLITGRYPHSTGAMRLHDPLPVEQVTFTEGLRHSGYYTAQAGKWHLGAPTKAKFDLIREGGGPSGCDHWIDVLKSRPKEKPFFCWFAALDAHRDYQPNAIAQPHRPEDVTVPPYYPDAPEVRADLALYYDEISRLDSYVGKVLDELSAQGVADNTLVIFMADNGRPFPRCKTTVYDSGIRPPFLVRWPARVKAGSVSQSLISSIDLAPTFLALAGAKAAPSMQGRSFEATLSNPDAPARTVAFAEHNWHDFDDHQRSVRTGRFKYIRTAYTDLPQTPPADAVRGETFQAMLKWKAAEKLTDIQQTCFRLPRPAEELFDVEADPHELRNLANDPQHAKTLDDLRAELTKWERETEDRVPASRAPEKFHRETGLPLAGKPKR